MSVFSCDALYSTGNMVDYCQISGSWIIWYEEQNQVSLFVLIT